MRAGIENGRVEMVVFPFHARSYHLKSTLKPIKEMMIRSNNKLELVGATSWFREFLLGTPTAVARASHGSDFIFEDRKPRYCLHHQLQQF